MSVTSWFLASSAGPRHRLPREMIFVGREDCELMLQSRSVDKQHAVINYEPTTDEHLVKDLGSLNGTFVNDLRIPDQTYITLKLSDILRFGYDPHVYVLEKSQHKVPEEALKHEKLSSQLQFSLKTSEKKNEDEEKRGEKKNQELPVSRPTPLYGQPAWWGEEEDYGSKEPQTDIQKDVPPVGRDFSPAVFSSRYFEIPTKDFQRTPGGAELHEIPTKDTDTPPAPPSPPTQTPPIVQSHASFTIEFDECAPGRMKIKDHVTKFSTRHRRAPPTAAPPTGPDLMSSESKVADWLVNTDVITMRRRPQSDDVYSTKSDLAVNARRVKGHHHDDGTQSDSEDPLQQGSVQPEQPEASQAIQSEAPERPLSQSPPRAPSPPPGPPDPPPQQAFVIEFFDPRKKRSQSFTHNPAHSDTGSALRAKLERRRGGERPASLHGPPTQQVSIPLKGPTGPQRSSSLKRERGEGDAAPARPSSSAGLRPFGSVGRKSKLTQEFSELLKDAPPLDSSPPPRSAPPVMVAPTQAPSTPPSSPRTQLPALSQPSARTASPSRPPGSSGPPLGVRGGNLGGTSRPEEEDSQSDAGTYTIETEMQDQEVEEARSRIDQVFGVLDSPDCGSSGVTRPIISEADGSSSILDQVDPLQGLIPPVPGQVSAGLEEVKWVSRWASLADNFTEPGQGGVSGAGSGLGVGPSSGPGLGHSFDPTESRTRRLLPQRPSDRLEAVAPSILVCQQSYLVQDRVPGPPHPQSDPVQDLRDRIPGPQEDSAQCLSVQDDVDPDSLSDASRSDEALVHDEPQKNRFKMEAGPPGATKSTSFYIGSGALPGRPDPARSPGQSERTRDPPARQPPTTVLIRHLSGPEPRRAGVKPNSSAPDLQSQDRDSVPTRDAGLSSFVRQESFTRDRPLDSVQMRKLPHISSHPSLRDLEQGRGLEPDQQPPPPDSAGTLCPVDTGFTRRGGSSGPVDDSLSGDSDVDTASTVSQVSSKNAPLTSASKKRPALSSFQKDKSSSSKDKGRQPSARERLSEKRRGQPVTDTSSRAEPVRRVPLRRSSGTRGSLDLSEGPQGPGLHRAEAASSDQDVSRPSGRGKKHMPLQKDDNGKTVKAAAATQVLTRSNSLSAPRPTRASMLRRARLGEASDNEGAETDRGSHSSDQVVPAKATTEGRKLSRLDILAMPRRRTGSFTAPSDTETSSASRTTTSNRSAVPASDTRSATSRGGGAASKQQQNRVRSSGAKGAGTGVRRRPKESDFSSSSEDDFLTGVTTTKAKRSSQALPPSSSNPASRSHRTRTRSVSLETEEDEDPYQNWSTHSAEIAKLSQDLAKDLAILAREIHDVAGDGESPGTSTVTNLSPGSQPNTPNSAMSAREELVQRIPEASLQYQKVPPGSDLNRNENQLDSSEQPHPWNHQEVLLLSPVSQISSSIRENTEQLVQKMKGLFQPEVWEQIEAQINSENQVPLMKTSNKEISSILMELRRVQKQLEVINTIVEPGSGLQTVGLAQPRPIQKERKPPGRSRGGSSNTNESTKRTSRGSNGGPQTA